MLEIFIIDLFVVLDMVWLLLLMYFVVIFDGNWCWVDCFGLLVVDGYWVGGCNVYVLLLWCEEIGILFVMLWLLFIENF